MGAEMVNELEQAEDLLEWIQWLDENSIYTTCKLVGYDVAYKRGPQYFTSIDNIQPNRKVIKNIEIMVKRSRQFLKKENKSLDLSVSSVVNLRKMGKTSKKGYVISRIKKET